MPMSLKSTFLALGIAIVFAVFFAYGLNVFYEYPDYEPSNCYEKFRCYDLIEPCKIENSTPEVGRKCNSEQFNSEEYKHCNELQKECEDEFASSNSRYIYSKNSFYILLLISIISLVVGSVIKTDGVGSGIIGGGVLLIVYNLILTSSYWLRFSSYFKLSAIGVVLAILIYLGFKKFGNGKKN